MKSFEEKHRLLKELLDEDLQRHTNEETKQ